MAAAVGSGAAREAGWKPVVGAEDRFLQRGEKLIEKSRRAVPKWHLNSDGYQLPRFDGADGLSSSSSSDSEPAEYIDHGKAFLTEPRTTASTALLCEEQPMLSTGRKSGGSPRNSTQNLRLGNGSPTASAGVTARSSLGRSLRFSPLTQVERPQPSPTGTASGSASPGSPRSPRNSQGIIENEQCIEDVASLFLGHRGQLCEGGVANELARVIAGAASNDFLEIAALQAQIRKNIAGVEESIHELDATEGEKSVLQKLSLPSDVSLLGESKAQVSKTAEVTFQMRNIRRILHSLHWPNLQTELRRWVKRGGETEQNMRDFLKTIKAMDREVRVLLDHKERGEEFLVKRSYAITAQMKHFHAKMVHAAGKMVKQNDSQRLKRQQLSKQLARQLIEQKSFMRQMERARIAATGEEGDHVASDDEEPDIPDSVDADSPRKPKREVEEKMRRTKEDEKKEEVEMPTERDEKENEAKEEVASVADDGDFDIDNFDEQRYGHLKKIYNRHDDKIQELKNSIEHDSEELAKVQEEIMAKLEADMVKSQAGAKQVSSKHKVANMLTAMGPEAQKKFMLIRERDALAKFLNEATCEDPDAKKQLELLKEKGRSAEGLIMETEVKPATPLPSEVANNEGSAKESPQADDEDTQARALTQETDRFQKVQEELAAIQEEIDKGAQQATDLMNEVNEEAKVLGLGEKIWSVKQRPALQAFFLVNSQKPLMSALLSSGAAMLNVLPPKGPTVGVRRALDTALDSARETFNAEEEARRNWHDKGVEFKASGWKTATDQAMATLIQKLESALEKGKEQYTQLESRQASEGQPASFAPSKAAVAEDKKPPSAAPGEEPETFVQRIEQAQQILEAHSKVQDVQKEIHGLKVNINRLEPSAFTEVLDEEPMDSRKVSSAKPKPAIEELQVPVKMNTIASFLNNTVDRNIDGNVELVSVASGAPSRQITKSHMLSKSSFQKVDAIQSKGDAGDEGRADRHSEGSVDESDASSSEDRGGSKESGTKSKSQKKPREHEAKPLKQRGRTEGALQGAGADGMPTESAKLARSTTFAGVQGLLAQVGGAGGKPTKAKKDLEVMLRQCERTYKVLLLRRNQKYQMFKRNLVRIGLVREADRAVQPEILCEKQARLEKELQEAKGNVKALEKMVSFWDNRIKNRWAKLQEEKERRENPDAFPLVEGDASKKSGGLLTLGGKRSTVAWRALVDESGRPEQDGLQRGSTQLSLEHGLVAECPVKGWGAARMAVQKVSGLLEGTSSLDVLEALAGRRSRRPTFSKGVDPQDAEALRPQARSFGGLRKGSNVERLLMTSSSNDDDLTANGSAISAAGSSELQPVIKKNNKLGFGMLATIAAKISSARAKDRISKTLSTGAVTAIAKMASEEHVSQAQETEEGIGPSQVISLLKQRPPPPTDMKYEDTPSKPVKRGSITSLALRGVAHEKFNDIVKKQRSEAVEPDSAEDSMGPGSFGAFTGSQQASRQGFIPMTRRRSVSGGALRAFGQALASASDDNDAWAKMLKKTSIKEMEKAQASTLARLLPNSKDSVKDSLESSETGSDEDSEQLGSLLRRKLITDDGETVRSHPVRSKAPSSGRMQSMGRRASLTAPGASKLAEAVSDGELPARRKPRDTKLMKGLTNMLAADDDSISTQSDPEHEQVSMEEMIEERIRKRFQRWQAQGVAGNYSEHLKELENRSWRKKPLSRMLKQMQQEDGYSRGIHSFIHDMDAMDHEEEQPIKDGPPGSNASQQPSRPESGLSDAEEVQSDAERQWQKFEDSHIIQVRKLIQSVRDTLLEKHCTLSKAWRSLCGSGSHERLDKSQLSRALMELEFKHEDADNVVRYALHLRGLHMHVASGLSRHDFMAMMWSADPITSLTRLRKRLAQKYGNYQAAFLAHDIAHSRALTAEDFLRMCLSIGGTLEDSKRLFQQVCEHDGQSLDGTRCSLDAFMASMRHAEGLDVVAHVRRRITRNGIHPIDVFRDQIDPSYFERPLSLAELGEAFSGFAITRRGAEHLFRVVYPKMPTTAVVMQDVLMRIIGGIGQTHDRLQAAFAMQDGRRVSFLSQLDDAISQVAVMSSSPASSRRLKRRAKELNGLALNVPTLKEKAEARIGRSLRRLSLSDSEREASPLPSPQVMDSARQRGHARLRNLSASESFSSYQSALDMMEATGVETHVKMTCAEFADALNKSAGLDLLVSRELFMAVDEASSGRVSLLDLVEAVRRARPVGTLAELRHFLRHKGPGGSDAVRTFRTTEMTTHTHVGMEKWCKWLDCFGIQEEDSQILFGLVDTDGDGLVSQMEFEDALVSEQREDASGNFATARKRETAQLKHSMAGKGQMLLWTLQIRTPDEVLGLEDMKRVFFKAGVPLSDAVSIFNILTESKDSRTTTVQELVIKVQKMMRRGASPPGKKKHKFNQDGADPDELRRLSTMTTTGKQPGSSTPSKLDSSTSHRLLPASPSPVSPALETTPGAESDHLKSSKSLAPIKKAAQTDAAKWKKVFAQSIASDSGTHPGEIRRRSSVVAEPGVAEDAVSGLLPQLAVPLARQAQANKGRSTSKRKRPGGSSGVADLPMLQLNKRLSNDTPQEDYILQTERTHSRVAALPALSGTALGVHHSPSRGSRSARLPLSRPEASRIGSHDRRRRVEEWRQLVVDSNLTGEPTFPAQASASARGSRTLTAEKIFKSDADRELS